MSSVTSRSTHVIADEAAAFNDFIASLGTSVDKIQPRTPIETLVILQADTPLEAIDLEPFPWMIVVALTEAARLLGGLKVYERISAELERVAGINAALKKQRQSQEDLHDAIYQALREGAHHSEVFPSTRIGEQIEIVSDDGDDSIVAVPYWLPGMPGKKTWRKVPDSIAYTPCTIPAFWPWPYFCYGYLPWKVRQILDKRHVHDTRSFSSYSEAEDASPPEGWWAALGGSDPAAEAMRNFDHEKWEKRYVARLASLAIGLVDGFAPGDRRTERPASKMNQPGIKAEIDNRLDDYYGGRVAVTSGELPHRLSPTEDPETITKIIAANQAISPWHNYPYTPRWEEFPSVN